MNPYDKPNAKLVAGAFYCGLVGLGLTFTQTIIPGLILGGVAMVLALLSKGTDPSLDRRAFIGLVLGILCVLLNILIFCFTLYQIMTNPEMHQQFNEVFRNFYGIDFDTVWSTMFQNGNPQSLPSGADTF